MTWLFGSRANDKSPPALETAQNETTPKPTDDHKEAKTKTTQPSPQKMSESIYNLVPEQYTEPVKAPMYRSKYDPKAPLTSSTFGLHGTSATIGGGINELKKVRTKRATGCYNVKIYAIAIIIITIIIIIIIIITAPYNSFFQFVCLHLFLHTKPLP
jgi:hypothetical protein